MKPDTLMLIADAKLALERTARAAAAENPLAAAFASWLLADRFDVTTVSEFAHKAAAAKGAERSSRGVALLGFTCALTTLRSSSEASFDQHLNWLVGRPNFSTGGGEPCGVLVDPVMLLGVCVGANAILAGERKTNFTTWAQAAWKDAVGIIGNSGWRGNLLHLLAVQLEKNNSAANAEAKLSPAWLRAALNPRDWATVEDAEAAEVLRAAISGADAVSDGFEAVIRLAAVDWAVARALDFNLDAMTITDVARVLNNVTSVFQRWTWEEKPRTAKRGAVARQWHIDNEYHVQSLLYVILKPVFPALEEEKYVASTGTYQPRADLCLLALRLVIEIKFWYRGDKARELIEQIAADLSLYLRSDSPYRQVIAVVWDDGARTEEHDELKRGLVGLNGMHEVVILNRPSLMGV